MTQKHTPGPWTFHCLEPDPHGVIMIGGWEISTRLYDVVGGSPGVAPIRNKADARLIAAAPDLLAACQNALDALYLMGDDESHLAYRQAAVKELEAALAKAKEDQHGN